MRGRAGRGTAVLVVGLATGLTLLAGCSEPGAPAPAGPGGASTSGSTAPGSTAGAPTSATAAPAGSASTSPAPSTTASVVPSRPVQTAAPRPIDQTGRTQDAEVSLTSVRARRITARGPGDTSGPGVMVRLQVRNTGGRTLDTGLVQVNVANGAGAPGSLVNGAPTEPLPGSLKSGRTASGTYGFVLADAGSGALTVLVQVSPGQPVLQFRGRATSS